MRFTGRAEGSDVDEDSTPDKAFVEAPGWGRPNKWFNRVPETKIAKNRVHLHLRAGGTIADEVRRLAALGAVVVRSGDELVVMEDPEGNDFCIEWKLALGGSPTPRCPGSARSTPEPSASRTAYNNAAGKWP